MLRLWFKFEPHRFINGLVIGNSSFEPPSWPPFWPFLIFGFKHFILRVQFKFEPNRFINGSDIVNQSLEPPFWPPS